MKQFATPLAITGDHNEIDKLIPELVALGYNTTNFNLWRHDHNYLLTNFVKVGRLGWNQGVGVNTVVYIGDKELILALATMVEGVKVYPGEYIVMVGDYGSRILKIGNIYKVLKLQDDGKQNYEDQDDDTFFTLKHDNNQGIAGYLSPPRGDFKKVTKEEIIQYFNQKNIADTSGRSTGQAISQSVSKDTVKKIIGWNVKPGIDRIAALKSIGWERNIAARGYELKHESDAYNEAIKLGVLSALFVPVYEEDSKRSISIGGRTFEFDKDIVSYSYNSVLYSLTKSDIEGLINVHGSKFSCNGIPYFIKSLSFGCEGQISIEMSDIVKIFNELNRE